MESGHFLEIKKEAQKEIIEFFDLEQDDDLSFSNYSFKYLQNPEYQKYWVDRQEKIYLVHNISNNHKRSVSFYRKIERLILLIQEEIKSFPNIKRFEFFKKNKIALHILFKHKLIISEQSIVDSYFPQNEDLFYYFFPEFQEFLPKKQSKKMKGRIYYLLNLHIENSEDFKIFDEKRIIGENDNYICNLIRNDMIQDFIVYFTKNNINASSKIKRSFFETNPLLIKKEISLIEYAAFFGSIEIFTYLFNNKAELNKSLWLYAIHSNDGSLIHFLEEQSNLIPYNTDLSFKKEILKIHNYNIADYFINNVWMDTDNDYLTNSIKYNNYCFYPKDLGNHFAFYLYCKHGYLEFVKILLNEGHKFDNNAITFSNEIQIKKKIK